MERGYFLRKDISVMKTMKHVWISAMSFIALCLIIVMGTPVSLSMLLIKKMDVMANAFVYVRGVNHDTNLYLMWIYINPLCYTIDPFYHHEVDHLEINYRWPTRVFVAHVPLS